MNRIVIDIPGHPVAKGRARSHVIRKKSGGIATTKGGAPIIKHYTPEKTRRWEEQARYFAAQEMRGNSPLTGPIELHLEIRLAIPASWPAWKRGAALCQVIMPTSKPDSDNVEKAAKDAMNGVVWLDDSQVVTSSKRKGYSQIPGVRLVVIPLPAAPASVTNRKQLEQHLEG